MNPTFYTPCKDCKHNLKSGYLNHYCVKCKHTYFDDDVDQSKPDLYEKDVVKNSKIRTDH